MHNFISHQCDEIAINTIRTLSADVVQKANSGHPGAPMGCAPMAHVLFSRFISTNPKNPFWINRDRFVLSNGHGCALQYVILHLLGSPIMPMEELQHFRQLGSRTPGHPETHLTPGIEVTTGPLGQGISAAVGLAIAQEHLAATFNKPGFDLFTNHTYTIVGDGCLQEGVSSEACSLAGHLKLGRLIVLYDDNHITIDGNTNLSFTEDVLKRYESYGWHTLSISDGDSTNPDSLKLLAEAIDCAKSVTDRPSIIRIRTTIGFGSAKAGTHDVHGAPLGSNDLANVKSALGFDPKLFFHVSPSVYEYYSKFSANSASREVEWTAMRNLYAEKYPAQSADLARREAGKLPENLEEILPRYSSKDAAVATRKLSEILLNAIAPSAMPELIGGSADLTSSNLTRWRGAIDFQHAPQSQILEGSASYAGRYLRFGVREHAMAAICNGLAAYGCLIPFCATFLNFISYALGAVRISALSHAPVIYIMTHDSIGLGEDGPTHQPIETLASLRAMPGLLVFRPADGNEVSGSYLAALGGSKANPMIKPLRPSVIALSRQNTPHLTGSSIESVMLGAYVIHQASPSSKNVASSSVCIVATGTEVQLAILAADSLSCSTGLKISVVSMPCWELFDEQSEDYKKSVFPVGVPVISVEALSVFGWERYAHVHVGMNTFGASAPAPQVYEKFGITVAAIISKTMALLEFYKGRPVPEKMITI